MSLKDQKNKIKQKGFLDINGIKLIVTKKDLLKDITNG